MSWSRQVVGVALVGLAASCTSSSTTISSDPTTTPLVTTSSLSSTTSVASAPPTSNGSETFVPRWSHTGVGMSNSFGASSGDIVMANDDFVFVADGFGHGDDQHNVTAFDADTGEVLWQRDDLPELGSNGAVFLQALSGETLIVNAQHGPVAAVDTATGSTLWVSRLPLRYGATRSTVSGDVLFVAADATFEGDIRPPVVLAVDLRDGSQVWATALAEGTDLQWHSPPIADGLIFVSSTISHPESADGNMVHALDLSTGEVAWSIGLGGEQGFSFAPGLIARGVLAVSSHPQGTVALDVGNGAQMWVVPDAFPIGLSPDGQFLAYGPTGVVELDLQTGADVLVIPAEDLGTIPYDAKMHQGALIVSEPGWVESYDLNSGRRLWRINVATTNAPVAYTDEFLVAPTADPIGVSVFDIP